MWMTQAAWPALICQLYDYYFERTAAFFGAKTACESIHILWDQVSNVVKVANNTILLKEKLQAEAWIYDFDGREQWHQVNVVNVPATSAQDCFPLLIPEKLDRVRFVRLLLRQGSAVLSENFYWSPAKPGDCRELNTLKELRLPVAMHTSLAGDSYTITVKVSNPNPAVALAIRLKLLHGQSDERILPAFYEDNYFSLVPNGEKIVRIRVSNSGLKGKIPRLSVSGWNIKLELHSNLH